MEKIIHRDVNGIPLVIGDKYVDEVGDQFEYLGASRFDSQARSIAVFTNKCGTLFPFLSEDGVFKVRPAIDHVPLHTYSNKDVKFKDVHGNPLIIGGKYQDEYKKVYTLKRLYVENDTYFAVFIVNSNGYDCKLFSPTGTFKLERVITPVGYAQTIEKKSDNPEKEDSIIKEIRELLLQRSQTGISKYGVTLDRKDLKPSEWCQHLLEELLDASGYVLRLKKDLEQIEQLCNNNKG